MLALIGVLSILGIYAFGCYVVYRVIRKFDQEVFYMETLIPIYNVYLLAKQVMVAPGKFITINLVVLFLGSIGAGVYHSSPAVSLANFILYSLTAYLWGKIAKGLGKNFWLHAVLAFFNLPLL
ncbi:hypothetical protein SPSIL_038460 [Sporomusa silvacetica DSM 10669]|uniref:Uncharacterized protein n=1 Tax=Sporomusa silvacetica DSM 10669 TaxID=1123289 RepID=A0ABZ3IPL7_9FIRM|nr:hypothetical protein [Sporomusa silvacetica]OZC14097.1 hypothetical protein SPSIL_50380 [Sporomusa silvacetica DSM 10669]